MDKARKLRRYEQKDYTQLVDFPVEIVGRDGVVRRYSFEESIRLYQRRIASAQARYADGEVVDAEVIHCRQRIGQLRRSYFARYGWAALRVGDRPGLLAGEFAGEVAAFLRRVLSDPAQPGEPTEPVSFALLEDDEHHQLYYVRLEGSPEEQPWLLYLYRFSSASACPGREAFFRALKVLQSVSADTDAVEQLIGFHHTADCGLILTGGDAVDGPSVKTEVGGARAVADDIEWLGFAAVEDDPLQAAFSALRRGRLSDALLQFGQAYEAQPFRRAAYVGAGVVADQLGAFDAAETAALMGIRYLPADPLLRHHLALVHLRHGRPHEALGALDAQPTGVQAMDCTRLLRGLAEMQRGHWLRGAQQLRRVAKVTQGVDPDPDLREAAERTLRTVTVASLGVGLVSLVSMLPLLIDMLGRPQPTALLATSLALWPIAAFGVGMWGRQRLRRLLRAPSGWGLRLANPVSLRDTARRES